MAVATRGGTIVSDQYVEVRIFAQDRVVADTARAGLLRHQFLDEFEAADVLDRYPVVIDLNQLTVLTPDAADELVVRWLERVRSPRRPVIAAIATYSRGIAGALTTALRDAKQCAYLVRSAPIGEVPRAVGEVTNTLLDTLDAVRIQEQGRATARAVAEHLHLNNTTAANRLAELVGRGLLQRQAQPGKLGDLFVYPWPAVTGPDFVPSDMHAPQPATSGTYGGAARTANETTIPGRKRAVLQH